MLDVLLPSAVSAPSCGANQYVDSDGYCVACGDGTAGANPKDRTTCLCKSGWGFFSADHDGRCSALSRWLCFPFCMPMLPAAVREQGGTEPWASGLEPAHRWSQLPQPAEGLLLYLASCSENVPGWAVFVPRHWLFFMAINSASSAAVVLPALPRTPRSAPAAKDMASSTTPKEHAPSWVGGRALCCRSALLHCTALTA